jgi:O-antigen/teichoic acid export membrane protein
MFAFGLNTAFLIKYYKVDGEQKKKLFSIVTRLFLVVIPITLISLPFVSVFKDMFGEDFQSVHLGLLGGTILFTLYYQLFTIILRLQLRAYLFVVYTVGYALLTGLLNLWFIIDLKLSYFSFLYSSFIINTLFMLIGTVIYRSFFVSVNLREDIKLLKGLLKISRVKMPIEINSITLISGDRYILSALRGAEAVGIYSIGYRFGYSFENFVNIPFFNAYNPVAYKIFAEDRQQFIELQRKYLTIYGLMAGVFLLSVSVCFDHLFRYFIDPRFWSAYVLCGVIGLAYVFQGISYVFEVILAMSEKLGYLLAVGVGCTVLNLSLNVALIPLFGISGAAVATLASYIVMATGTFYLSNRVLRIGYDLMRLCFILVVCIATVVVQHAIGVKSILLSLGMRILLGIICVVVLYTGNKSIIREFIWTSNRIA